MKKIRFIAVLLLLFVLAGCGGRGKSEDPDDKAVYEDNETDSPSEDFIQEETSLDSARDIVLAYAVSQIGNSEGNISISDEEQVTIKEETCYVFKIAEETDEKSLTLDFYAFGVVSNSLYRLDAVADEFIFIKQIHSVEELADNTTESNDASNDTSLEKLVAAVQQSKSLTVEMNHDPNSQIPFPAEDMSYLMANFTTDNLKPCVYPYLFIPEYCIRSDNDVTFYVMQDTALSESSFAVLQFNGSATLYKADPSIYEDFVRLLSPSTDVNMAQMHVFYNGATKDSSIDDAVKGNGIYTAALEYFTNSGYALASMMEEDIFRVDKYGVTEMSDVDPRLVSVSIEYSVKTAYENAPDKWVTGNVFVGALWIDQQGDQYRAYVLGVMPYSASDGLTEAEVANSIYEKSLAKLLNE